MTDEIEQAFEEWWLSSSPKQQDTTDRGLLRKQLALADFEAGYKAGAESNQPDWNLESILRAEKQKREEAIKAERARVLGEVREYVRALKNGWTTTETWGRAVIDTCELLEHRLKEHE